MLCATLINKVVDVPIINEATEQIIALKAVDVVADHMEAELEKGWTRDVLRRRYATCPRRMSTSGSRKSASESTRRWTCRCSTRPRRGIVIEMVVKLIAHKFVEGNKKREKKGWFGR